jgi:predicted CoA-substrate-specific enzyme activase
MYLGVDIGSSSSKVALINERREVLGATVVNKGTGTSGVTEAMAQVLGQAGVEEKDIVYTVVTGYGRITYRKADRQITEISCHAKGASFLVPDIATIIDIGGQDAKIIRLAPGGVVENFVMNEKCAAGTGRFLEVMARVLGCGLGELSDLARKATKQVPISSVCTVFAESEVISQLAGGEQIENVAKGAHVAIAKRVAGMYSRAGGRPKVAMTGGVALNADMVDTMGEVLGTPVTVVPHCQAVGAVGAALFAYEFAHKT